MEMVLRRAGFQVTLTGDPYEVLELLATNSFDALLLDNWMPKLNGIELCRLIRSINDDVVIVFCSGAVAESDKQAAFAAGADGFIGKPFLPQDYSYFKLRSGYLHRNQITERPTWSSASQVGGRLSASVGHCPHPSDQPPNAKHCYPMVSCCQSKSLRGMSVCEEFVCYWSESSCCL